MILKLNKAEEELLKAADISYSLNKEYSDDEAFALVDEIVTAEAGYANDPDQEYYAQKYGDLADKIIDSINRIVN